MILHIVTGTKCTVIYHWNAHGYWNKDSVLQQAITVRMFLEILHDFHNFQYNLHSDVMIKNVVKGSMIYLMKSTFLKEIKTHCF